MERNLNDVFQEAVQLPEGDRATLAGFAHRGRWSEEIERRLSEIDAGIVELISWDDVRSELFEESVILDDEKEPLMKRN